MRLLPSWPDAWVYRLNDPVDRWLAIDKVAHFFGAAYALELGGWGFAVLASLAVELVELVRWTRLRPEARERVLRGQLAWPFLRDRVSLKDLVADGAGMGFAALAGAATGGLGLLWAVLR